MFVYVCMCVGVYNNCAYVVWRYLCDGTCTYSLHMYKVWEMVVLSKYIHHRVVHSYIVNKMIARA